MPNFNSGNVLLDFKDARRMSMRDTVRLTFDNFHLKSLNFRVIVDQFPATLNNVPASPTGLWTVFVQPEHYRPKSFFVSVPSSDTVGCEQFFFLDPDRARPTFPSANRVFSEAAWKPLADLLNESEVGELSGTELYTFLTKKERLLAAALFNLHARMRAIRLLAGRDVFSYLGEVARILQDRIYAKVDTELHGEVVKSVKKKTFDPASGLLHEFPEGYTMLKKSGSFKTPEKAGNLQLTFAGNLTGEMLVDADVDEAKGVKHAFEVLGHIFTGERTHPYDIHQILSFFYEDIELGYDLAPA